MTPRAKSRITGSHIYIGNIHAPCGTRERYACNKCCVVCAKKASIRNYPKVKIKRKLS